MNMIGYLKDCKNCKHLNTRRCMNCFHSSNYESKPSYSEYWNNPLHVGGVESVSITRVTPNGARITETKTDGSVLPNVKNLIFSGNATIVLWSDGTKTVVKAHAEDFDPEKGLAMAIAKKALGNKGNYYNKMKKAIDVALLETYAKMERENASKKR